MQQLLNAMPNPKNIHKIHELIAKQQFDNITDKNWEQMWQAGSYDGTIRLWSLWKVHLKQFISEPTSLEHVKWIEDTLEEQKLTGAERKWLECLLTLMRWQMGETSFDSAQDDRKRDE
ncbi:MAG: hypothetical protein GY801_17655 [bacterium]|nr:hypothetical protein [bacterium]